jgi:hypothetical protein
MLCDKNLFNIIDEKEYEKLDDMTKPLNNYIINSSRNIYFDDYLFKEFKIDKCNFLINNGCRYIELNIYVYKMNKI